MYNEFDDFCPAEACKQASRDGMRSLKSRKEKRHATRSSFIKPPNPAKTMQKKVGENILCRIVIGPQGGKVRAYVRYQSRWRIMGRILAITPTLAPRNLFNSVRF